MTRVFMVHGNPDTHHLWDLVIPHLQRGSDVVALDLPGFAERAPEGWGASKEDYVDWLTAIVSAEAEISGPVDLVGHDWGSMIALRVAMQRPHLVRSIAAGGGPIDEHYVLHPVWRMLGEPGVGEEWVASTSAADIAEAVQAMGVPQAFAALNCMRTPGAGDCILRLYRSAMHIGREWGPDLPKITASSLFIWGERDHAAPVETGRRMASRIGAELLVLPTDHFWPYEAPDDVAQALRRLWARSAPTDPRERQG